MAGGPEQERVIGHQRRRKKQRRGARPQRCRTAICILPRQTKKSSAGISPTAVSLVKNASPQAITAAYHHPTPPLSFSPFLGGESLEVRSAEYKLANNNATSMASCNPCRAMATWPVSTAPEPKKIPRARRNGDARYCVPAAADGRLRFRLTHSMPKIPSAKISALTNC